jgi:intracellular septation protein
MISPALSPGQDVRTMPQSEIETKAPADNKPVVGDKPVEPAQSVLAKLAVELGPLLVFFGTNAAAGIYVGTGAFMVATLLSLGFAWWRYRKVPIMPLVSAALVLTFGGLTIYLHDDTFIKLKPTIVYTLFAVLLVAGLVTRRPVLQALFGPVFNLTEQGWRKLSLRWAVFFVAMAVLNEYVWRNFSTDIWVSFKAFGFLPITFLFAIAQVPLMQRYALPENDPSN